LFGPLPSPIFSAWRAIGDVPEKDVDGYMSEPHFGEKVRDDRRLAGAEVTR